MQLAKCVEIWMMFVRLIGLQIGRDIAEVLFSGIEQQIAMLGLEGLEGRVVEETQLVARVPVERVAEGLQCGVAYEGHDRVQHRLRSQLHVVQTQDCALQHGRGEGLLDAGGGHRRGQVELRSHCAIEALSASGFSSFSIHTICSRPRSASAPSPSRSAPAPSPSRSASAPSSSPPTPSTRGKCTYHSILQPKSARLRLFTKRTC